MPMSRRRFNTGCRGPRVGRLAERGSRAAWNYPRRGRVLFSATRPRCPRFGNSQEQKELCGSSLGVPGGLGQLIPAVPRDARLCFNRSPATGGALTRGGSPSRITVADHESEASLTRTFVRRGGIPLDSVLPGRERVHGYLHLCLVPNETSLPGAHDSSCRVPHDCITARRQQDLRKRQCDCRGRVTQCTSSWG